PPPPPPPPPAPVTAAVTATAASEPATEPASEPSVELPAPPPVPTAELPAPPPLPSIELPAPPPLPTVELPAPPPILTGRTEVAPAAEAGPEFGIDIASLESEEGTGWNAVEQVEAVWTAEARAQIGPDPGPVDGAPVAFDATSFDEMAALRAVMVLERAADRIEHLAGDRASAAWAATQGLDGELKAQFEAACERHQDALARSVGELRSLAARLVRATVEATELELSR
ncbi:MAG: hypothetical protein OEY23_22670, partial [Acidimicrobiia bacterium]|nr:hypothetical protein [Acidimicrobiia bacterium]